MHVTPIDGEDFRYHVHSDNRDFDHLVDISAQDFKGECSCEDFTFRCNQRSQHAICKHISVARTFFIRRELRLLGITLNHTELEYVTDEVLRTLGEEEKRARGKRRARAKVLHQQPLSEEEGGDDGIQEAPVSLPQKAPRVYLLR